MILLTLLTTKVRDYFLYNKSTYFYILKVRILIYKEYVFNGILNTYSYKTILRYYN